MMNLLKRRARTCPADLGAVIADGGGPYWCERDPGHKPPHRRESPPYAAEWTDLPGGGRDIAFVRSVP